MAKGIASPTLDIMVEMLTSIDEPAVTGLLTQYRFGHSEITDRKEYTYQLQIINWAKNILCDLLVDSPYVNGINENNFDASIEECEEFVEQMIFISSVVKVVMLVPENQSVVLFSLKALIERILSV